MEGLSDILRRHLLEPRGAGNFSARDGGREDGATYGSGRGLNPACGDELHLHLREDRAGRLEARFEARACSAVLAVASLLCERLSGLDREGAARIGVEALVEAAGGLGPVRRHAILVADRALREALRGWNGPGPS